jgi:hypothetical protein
VQPGARRGGRLSLSLSLSFSLAFSFSFSLAFSFSFSLAFSFSFSLAFSFSFSLAFSFSFSFALSLAVAFALFSVAADSRGRHAETFRAAVGQRTVRVGVAGQRGDTEQVAAGERKQRADDEDDEDDETHVPRMTPLVSRGDGDRASSTFERSRATCAGGAGSSAPVVGEADHLRQPALAH